MVRAWGQLFSQIHHDDAALRKASRKFWTVLREKVGDACAHTRCMCVLRCSYVYCNLCVFMSSH